MSNSFPRLSEKEYVTLQLLISNARPLYGLELVMKSEGALPRGTIYVLLDRMERKGYVTSQREEPREGVAGMPRRLYQPTGFGAKVYQLSRQLHSLISLKPAFG